MCTGTKEAEERALALLGRKWDTSEPGYVEGVKAYLSDPDTLLSAQDRVNEAEESLNSATRKMRGAIAAAYSSGMSYPAIGKTLGLSADAVRRLVGAKSR